MNPRHHLSPTLRLLPLFCLALALLLAGILAPRPVQAEPLPDASHPQSVWTAARISAAGQPSTPQLIEAAYQRGEISAEQRLLYLAYAVYEYASLPEQFHSNAPWWGTQVVAEIKVAATEMNSDPGLSVSQPARAEIERLLSPQAATVCDVNDGANNTDSTNFHVNYGAIGGGLSISDYTTSLETTFATEVTSYGWAKPPLCTASACTNDNPWDRYPVQVSSLGGGLYGYVTYPGGSYTGFIGNNPNTTATETVALASCMVLNSDYSGFPGGALFSVQVTAAHEFVHSIQYGYGDPPSFDEDDIWYESIAAYMEDEVYDAANDNYQYLYPSFTSCMGEFSGDVYSDWLFFRYAAERTGGTNVAGGGEDVAQAFWANVSLGQTGLGAYNNALSTKGANLNDIYHNYAIASRFMKSCPASSPYCFEEAAGYVSAAGTPANQGSVASVPGSYTGSVSNHYALNWVGLPASGTYAVILANNSASSGTLRASVVANTPSGLVVTAVPGLANASGMITLPSYSVPSGATSVVVVITNQQKTADNPSSCTAAGYTLSLKFATTTTLTASVNPSTYGQNVTFTATVTSGGGTPTGTVTFKDGAATLGTGTLSGGVATYSTAALAVGSHTITAEYGGDASFAASTGALSGNPLVVNQVATTVTLVSSANPTTYGQNVTFTATVTSGAGTPTGTVTFKDGAATLGTGTLSGGVATFSTAALAAGSHSITAEYGGDVNFAGSLSAALTQHVNQYLFLPIVLR